MKTSVMHEHVMNNLEHMKNDMNIYKYHEYSNIFKEFK